MNDTTMTLVTGPRPHGLAERTAERGMILILSAVLGLLLIGMMGLAVDAAFVLTTEQQLQGAADAAALAAARQVRAEAKLPGNTFDATRQAAIEIAVANKAAAVAVQLEANLPNHLDGDIVVGIWDKSAKTFTPNTATPNAVQVRARRTSSSPNGALGLLFGPVWGVGTSEIGVVSTAVFEHVEDPLVLVLDPTQPHTLNLNGTNDITLLYGKVHVNSSHACGLNLVGTPTLHALKATVVGGACFPEGSITGPVYEGEDPWPDPLAYVLPDDASWDAFKAGLPMPLGPAGVIDADGTYNPGYYPYGVDLDSSETAFLNPGYYMFGEGGASPNDGGMQLTGSAYVTGYGVTLFIDEDAGVDISGTGAGMTLTPPGAGDPFEGVSMFHHRDNDGNSESKLTGDGLLSIEGIIYVPSGEVVLGGTPGQEIGALWAAKVTTEGTTGFVFTGKGLPVNESNELYSYLVQ
jgi:Flp pilus assembly protein TadG